LVVYLRILDNTSGESGGFTARKEVHAGNAEKALHCVCEVGWEDPTGVYAVGQGHLTLVAQEMIVSEVQWVLTFYVLLRSHFGWLETLEVTHSAVLVFTQ
jgi:hypothetical protein